MSITNLLSETAENLIFKTNVDSVHSKNIKNMYLTLFYKRFAACFKLRLDRTIAITNMTIEEWVCSVTPHGW